MFDWTSSSVVGHPWRSVYVYVIQGVYVRLDFLVGWRLHLDEVVGYLLNLGTVHELDIARCKFKDVKELHKLSAFPIKMVDVPNNFWEIDILQNSGEFICALASMRN